MRGKSRGKNLTAMRMHACNAMQFAAAAQPNFKEHPAIFSPLLPVLCNGRG